MKKQAKTKAFETLDAIQKTFFVFIANQSNEKGNPKWSTQRIVLQSGTLLIDSLRIFTSTDCFHSAC